MEKDKHVWILENVNHDMYFSQRIAGPNIENHQFCIINRGAVRVSAGNCKISKSARVLELAHPQMGEKPSPMDQMIGIDKPDWIMVVSRNLTENSVYLREQHSPGIWREFFKVSWQVGASYGPAASMSHTVVSYRKSCKKYWLI